jgi:Mn-dependent DtxR family transcriptional regulator
MQADWFKDYRRQVKQGERLVTPRPKPKRVVTENLLDLLDIDGGWLTSAGIADVLQMPEPTVSRTLYRLRTRNLVRYRNVELALSAHGRMQSRAEWRAA